MRTCERIDSAAERAAGCGLSGLRSCSLIATSGTLTHTLSRLPSPATIAQTGCPDDDGKGLAAGLFLSGRSLSLCHVTHRSRRASCPHEPRRARSQLRSSPAIATVLPPYTWWSIPSSLAESRRRRGALGPARRDRSCDEPEWNAQRPFSFVL